MKVDIACFLAFLPRRRMLFDLINYLIQASNPLVMVQAYRLLAAEMYKLGWDYPLHLGVTEAGEGEDGRMKSAIGIGALLADGLGDTVRVSLTEDPEYELVPCQTLINLGQELINDKSKFDVIPAWKETKKSRDFQNFQKRRGILPSQIEGDEVDVRGLMHRDGSVFTTVTLSDLKSPDALYRNLGAKMVVGMPFKDIATSDSIYLPEVPAKDDVASRKAIKRLQDVAVGVLAPFSELQEKPLLNSVAIVTLSDIAEKFGGKLPQLPQGSIRYAVKITGLEPEAYFAYLKSADAKLVMAILEVPTIASRVQASRRVFQMFTDNSLLLPVVHSMSFTPKDKDELILRTGSEAGALLVDGLGDGIMLQVPNFDTETLRVTSFNLLQVSTK
jgi:(E)-4-hydroxy-3-methylbut-2-enyl-diphosphate synthase